MANHFLWLDDGKLDVWGSKGPSFWKICICVASVCCANTGIDTFIVFIQDDYCGLNLASITCQRCFFYEPNSSTTWTPLGACSSYPCIASGKCIVALHSHGRADSCSCVCPLFFLDLLTHDRITNTLKMHKPSLGRV